MLLISVQYRTCTWLTTFVLNILSRVKRWIFFSDIQYVFIVRIEKNEFMFSAFFSTKNKINFTQQVKDFILTNTEL